MNIPEIKKTAEQKMQRSVESFKTSLGKIRTGRAHTGLLDHVMVDYYGQQIPIPQVASVSVIDSRTLGVSPWEKKLVPAIEKAIRESDLGLNPVSTGEAIRVPMPPLTEERRRDLTRVVRSEGEDAKVAIRNLRRDANNAVKELLKSKEISEDQERRAQDEIQKLTDRFIGDIDKALSTKETELMAV